MVGSVRYVPTYGWHKVKAKHTYQLFSVVLVYLFMIWKTIEKNHMSERQHDS